MILNPYSLAVRYLFCLPSWPSLFFTLGKLYLEEGNYEKALSWLYRVEMIDPDTSLKSEVGSKIVHCLETLGKFHAAEYALEARSSLQENREEELKGGKVVAEIGNRKITLREVDEALDELPPWTKEQFKGSEKKVEFMRKYVADELFYRKAKKPERMRRYEEVREWINNDYLNHKMKIAYQNLLKQVLTSSEVKLYPQVITKEETSFK